MNTVILAGRLGGDPDLQTSGQSQYVNFSVATSEYYDGEEQTEWHDLTAFGDMASNISEYFGKGDQIIVRGTLQSNSYTDNDGVERESTDVIVQEFDFGAPKGAGKNSGSGSSSSSPSTGGSPSGGEDEPFDDSEIPF